MDVKCGLEEEREKDRIKGFWDVDMKQNEENTGFRESNEEVLYRIKEKRTLLNIIIKRK